MIRVAAFAAVLSLAAASPSLACDWMHTSANPSPTTTAEAQPAAQPACPTCVAPGHPAKKQPVQAQPSPS